MIVDEKTAKYVLEVEGVRTYFCSATCKNEFEEHEKDYNKSSSSRAITAVTAVVPSKICSLKAAEIW